MAVLTDEELSDMKNKTDRMWTQFVELEKRIKLCEDAKDYRENPASKGQIAPKNPAFTPPSPAFPPVAGPFPPAT